MIELTLYSSFIQRKVSQENGKRQVDKIILFMLLFGFYLIEILPWALPFIMFNPWNPCYILLSVHTGYQVTYYFRD